MIGLPRPALLVAALAFGSALITVSVAELVRVVRQAASATPAARRRLFFACLGIVIGAWFLTYGVLSLALGV